MRRSSGTHAGQPATRTRPRDDPTWSSQIRWRQGHPAMFASRTPLTCSAPLRLRSAAALRRWFRSRRPRRPQRRRCRLRSPQRVVGGETHCCALACLLPRVSQEMSHTAQGEVLLSKGRGEGLSRLEGQTGWPRASRPSRGRSLAVWRAAGQVGYGYLRRARRKARLAASCTTRSLAAWSPVTSEGRPAPIAIRTAVSRKIQ